MRMPYRARIQFPCPSCGHTTSLDAGAMARTDEFPCKGCGTSLTITSVRKPKQGHTVSLRQTTNDGAHRTFDITFRPDGVWLFGNEHEKLVAESIELASDRAAAIIAGSIVENRITAAILARSSHVPKIEKRRFHASGAFGSFSVKIDLAYMMGIVTGPAYRDLVTLKDVRNSFAHRLDIKDFRSLAIRDKVKNLTLIDTHVGEFDNKADTRVIVFNYPAQPRIWVPRLMQRKNNSRHRYLITAQLFGVCLAFADLPAQQLPVI